MWLNANHEKSGDEGDGVWIGDLTRIMMTTMSLLLKHNVSNMKHGRQNAPDSLNHHKNHFNFSTSTGE